MLLRGRCRACGQQISLRYPAVELLTAVLFLICYLYFGLSWLGLKICVFGFLLIGLIFMDEETGLLPREFTYPGIVLGLGFSWLASTDSAGTAFLLRLFNHPLNNTQRLSLLDSVLGAAVGAGFFYVSWALYYLVRKKHGLGFGDIALMAMSGAFLGLKLVLLVIFAAPLLGVLYGVVILSQEALGKTSEEEADTTVKQPFLSREIPFGVLLGACSLVTAFAGQRIWSWYLGKF